MATSSGEEQKLLDPPLRSLRISPVSTLASEFESKSQTEPTAGSEGQLVEF